MNEKDKDFGCLQTKTKMIYQKIGRSDLWIRVEYFFLCVSPLKMEMHAYDIQAKKKYKVIPK